MRPQHGVPAGEQANAPRLAPRSEAAINPVVRTVGRQTAVTSLNSPLAAAAPWFLAALAVVLVAVFLSRGDIHAAGVPATDPQRYSTTEPDVAARLATQEEEINRLASKVDSLAEKFAAFRAPERVGAVDAPTRKLEHQPNSNAAARAAMEKDLEKLRQYVKDVSDSVALLDTQMSDPAVLQKKLEHQRALARP